MENTNNTIKVSEVALSILNSDNTLSVNVLSEEQRAFVNSVDEKSKPVAEKLCIYGNTKDCVDVDFFFTLYVYHIQRFEQSQCSVKSTLETIPDIFGIDFKADEENVRKLFKAFGRFFTSPENRKFFTRFGVTKLRVLSLVHESKTDKLFELIKAGTVNPFMTVSALKEIVKNINKSGTLSIDLDFSEKKSTSKKPVSKPETEQTATEQTATEQTATEQTATEQTATEQTATEQTATEQTRSVPVSKPETTDKATLEYNVEIEKIRQIVNRILPNNGIEKVITDILACFPTVEKYSYKKAKSNK